MQETWVQSLGREDPLEKEMATPSSTVAWKIPWMEENLGYSSWGHKESDTTKQLLKPAHPRARALQQETPPQRAAHTLQLESSPHSQLEKKARKATKSQPSQK